MWKALFKDGSELCEFEVINGKKVEQTFGRILNNLDALDNLSILQGAHKFTVNMKDGKFTCNISGIPYSFFALDVNTMRNKKLENIRPIYFVRETVEIQESNSRASNPIIDFVALGFQANLDGVNVKRYLAILPDGTYHIESK